MTDIELQNERADKKRRIRKTVFALAIGGAAGFLGALGMMSLADSGTIGTLDASAEIASLVGLVYLLTAVAILVGLAAPKAGATFLNVEDADEIREQKAMLGYSATGMGAAGLALVVVALSGPDSLIDPAAALIVYAVLTVIALVVSLKSRRHQDELMRALGQECAGLGFYLLVFIGGTWALLAQLGYVAAPAPLDWLTMMWGLLLLAAFIVVGRRGMMTMR